MTKLYMRDVKRLIEQGFITPDGGPSIEEMVEFQYFNLNDTHRDDGFPRFETIKCDAAEEGWASVPLRPSVDNLVFGYVGGCFYPMLLRDDYEMTDESIFRGDVCHPEYAYLERCGVTPPSQRGGA